MENNNNNLVPNNVPQVTYSITAQNSSSSVALSGAVPPEVVAGVEYVQVDQDALAAVKADEALTPEERQAKTNAILAEYQEKIKAGGSYTARLLAVTLGYIANSNNAASKEEDAKIIIKGLTEANTRDKDLVIDPASCQISAVTDAEGKMAYRVSGTVVFG